jgi:short-subunit dehydrogenase involved in D-alanine esterification of teichoic acids
MDRLISLFPEVSTLVNNAGIQVNKPLAQATAEEIEYELNINFLAPVLLARGYLPHLMSKPSAAIINVTSGLALVPKEVAAIYCASKAALHSFSKALRWQLDKSSVRVFEVMPPLVETAMTAGRGKGKISAEQLAEEFWRGFVADRYEMQIGKTKLLSAINRLAPSVADKIMRHGL